MPPVSNTPFTSDQLANAKRLGLGPNTISLNPHQTTAGMKAKQPGGLAPDTNNSIKSKFIAPAPEQTAGGTTQNKPMPVSNTPTATATPVPGGSTGITYPGIVGQLLQMAAQGSPSAQNYARTAADFGAGSIPVGQKAADIGNYFQQQAQSVLPTLGLAAGESTTGTTPVAQGLSTASYNAASNRLNALSTAEQQALAGTGQQLTAQNQASQAALGAGGQALTGQQLGQQGVQAAGQFAAPTLGQIGQVPFSPLNQEQGSPLGAPGGTAADAAKVAGSFQGAQAAAAAPGQAQAQNIQTAGTAGTQTAAQGYNQSVQSYQNMYTLNESAKQQAATVFNVLSSSGLNSGIPDWNRAINKLSGRLGSTNVTALTTALTELQNRYTQLLNSRGLTPTGSEEQALALLSPNSSAAQIASAVNQLDQAASNSLNPLFQQVQTYASQLGSGSTPVAGGEGAFSDSSFYGQ